MGVPVSWYSAVPCAHVSEQNMPAMPVDVQGHGQFSRRHPSGPFFVFLALAFMAGEGSGGGAVGGAGGSARGESSTGSGGGGAILGET